MMRRGGAHPCRGGAARGRQDTPAGPGRAPRDRAVGRGGGSSRRGPRTFASPAGLEFDLERLDVARALYERAIPIFVRVCGPDHVETSSALLNLGKLETRQNDLAAAWRHLERSLAIRQARLEAGDEGIQEVRQLIAGLGAH